jgi:hypothetical protein
MKTAAILLFLIFSSACTVESQNISKKQTTKAENQTKQTVLVELFTSEG